VLLSETCKILIAPFCIIENGIDRILNCDSKPIGARSEAAQSRREGKALKTAFPAKRTGNEFRPTGKLVRP